MLIYVPCCTSQALFVRQRSSRNKLELNALSVASKYELHLLAFVSFIATNFLLKHGKQMEKAADIRWQGEVESSTILVTT